MAVKIPANSDVVESDLKTVTKETTTGILVIRWYEIQLRDCDSEISFFSKLMYFL